jgi:hypothetical protein
MQPEETNRAGYFLCSVKGKGAECQIILYMPGRQGPEAEKYEADSPWSRGNLLETAN